VSKHWKPGGQTALVRPSRIRREPALAPGSRIRRAPPPVQKKVEPPSEEREIIGGIAGVVLLAFSIAALIVGISVATIFRNDPAAAARAMRFGQCYNAPGPNCVLDGDTIEFAGEKLQIAGIEAPKIDGARCSNERERGIEAAVRLAYLLNKGKVATAGQVAGPDGQTRTKVEVDGLDVGVAMVNAGVARDSGEGPGDWCS
jgi:endonuclease YncB( thermonuclease family)